MIQTKIKPIIVFDPGYSNFERKLIGLAFNEVKKCHVDNKARVISFLVHRKKIMSVGYNQEKTTHPLAVAYIHNKIHAECHCLWKVRHFNYPLSRMSLWNVRLRRDNTVANSTPCKNCLTTAGVLGLRSIYFTDDAGVFRKYEL